MKRYVEPASDSIVWGILPGLQAVAMGEIMGRLPVVECLITILNWRKQSSDQTGAEKEVKS